jgi:Xaa-Pro aminopeptidase
MISFAKEKLGQAIGYLEENNIDLWLIYSSEGSDPAINLLLGLKTVGRTFFFLCRSGKKICICSIIDAQEHADSGLFDEILTYKNEPDETLRDLVEKINPKKIALNFSKGDHLCDGLTTGRLRFLEKCLPGYTGHFVSSEPMLQRVRSIKSKEEIAAIRKAIEITQEIYSEVFIKLRPGLTEYQIGEFFLDGMKKRGVTLGTSKDLSMPIIMKERISHRSPGQAVLKPGDFLIMDFGVDSNGYCADIARTVYFLKEGETDAPEKFLNMFDAAYNAISTAFSAIKPGVEGWTVDNAARQYLLSRGMPEITHATGHQIGQFVHDGGAMFAPCWDRYPAAYDIIEAGMVLTLEPTILNPEGEFSVLCEENILVTETGAEFLSERQQRLILIPFK